MAPMTGPNDAPTRPKIGARFAGKPVIAMAIPIAAPASVIGIRLFGRPSIVERLLPMMNEQKHAGAIEPMAKRRSIALASQFSWTVPSAATVVFRDLSAVLYLKPSARLADCDFWSQADFSS